MQTNIAFKFKLYPNRYIYLAYRKSGIYYMISIMYTFKKYKTEISHFYYTKQDDANAIFCKLLEVYKKQFGVKIDIEKFNTIMENYEYKEII